MTQRGPLAPLFGLCAGLLLAGCAPPTHTAAAAPAAAAASSSPLAAARALEQASFGPTAESVAAVRGQGLAAWISQQQGLPPTLFDGLPLRDFDEVAQPGSLATAYRGMQDRLFAAFLMAPDQLRLRVTWSLSQILVVSAQKAAPYGLLEYANLLQRHAFGRYGDLLRAMTVHPTMGWYLDNGRNRAATACLGCTPNENFARELLQLFSIGTQRLQLDGTPMRDAQGRVLPAYGQQDVSELARALTGWAFVEEPGLAPSNPGNWGHTMVADQPELHDRGEKRVLGTVLPAGQNAAQDLDAVVALLVAHPNTAPFVSRRLIQHLVTSQPTPAYVERVARVFRDNGAGQRGDLGAVVRAVLLDREARRGDAGTTAPTSFGKLREPMLHHMALLRGLGCRRLPRSADGTRLVPVRQEPFNAPSVFSFYQPGDTAPVSGLLAPEQRLLDGQEFSQRMAALGRAQSTWGTALVEAGCDLPALAALAAVSLDALADEIGRRWFRGAMPPRLRAALPRLWADTDARNDVERLAWVLPALLLSPEFGVQL
ncbi:DUF1800 family protein [Aquabacterium sp.]|uniref:DUF1800 domain-containing protein n=1 Tax=Aquabacterium sp. TaxID=1872578 RepID=UPI003783BA44